MQEEMSVSVRAFGVMDKWVKGVQTHSPIEQFERFAVLSQTDADPCAIVEAHQKIWIESDRSIKQSLRRPRVT